MSTWDKTTLKILYVNMIAFSTFLGMVIVMMAYCFVTDKLGYLIMLDAAFALTSLAVLSMYRVAKSILFDRPEEREAYS